MVVRLELKVTPDPQGQQVERVAMVLMEPLVLRVIRVALDLPDPQVQRAAMVLTVLRERLARRVQLA